jgi:PAS domain S-box-containing protein
MDERGGLIAEINIEQRKQGVREQHDFEFLKKNGERIYTRLETGPIVDETGQYAGSIAAVADITERRQAELLLHASEQAFRAVVENSPDVIVRYDREGRRIYVNPQFERVNHLSTEEALGKKPSELSTELAPSADDFTEKLMAAMASATVTQIDISLIKEGKPICWFVRVVPEFDENGSVVSALTIWSDISERKQTEEKICRLNEELEQRVQERTIELAAKNNELERMNRIFVGRELRMIELKEQIKKLEQGPQQPAVAGGKSTGSENNQ